ncbi:MAG TPA: carboxylate-amine ligase [Patescibacteria group bacterium]|nr:carboxylate-amine ligase [Patescibacteria group bacterium]
MSSDGMLTVGVEEEYQIIDASGDLRSHIDTLLAAATPHLGDRVKREMMQSVVEVGTSICSNVEEARDQLAEMRRTLAELLRPEGLRIACAGTHPFSRWHEQQITDHDRYKMLEEELQDVVRSLLIFGLHIHVAIPDPDVRIEVLNEARYFLPHLLALSTSSPFWMGRNTGLKSYRSVIWSNFPRTGIPPDLTSFDEYENYVQLLVKTGSIDNGKKIWWDLRAHPSFPTLEFRVCDMPTRLEETICIAALSQAICAKLLKLRAKNLGFRKYMPALIGENKWRAIRYGLEGNLIDFGKQAEVPMRELALELVEFVDDVVDELGSRRAVEYVHTILAEGTSADRQLATFERTGDLRAVVEQLAEETTQGSASPLSGSAADARAAGNPSRRSGRAAPRQR